MAGAGGVILGTGQHIRNKRGRIWQAHHATLNPCTAATEANACLPRDSLGKDCSGASISRNARRDD